jgi:hypothetical protein
VDLKPSDKTCLSAVLSITNPTSIDLGMNMARMGKKQAQTVAHIDENCMAVFHELFAKYLSPSAMLHHHRGYRISSISGFPISELFCFVFRKHCRL